MPLTPIFSASQPVGEPSVVTLTDDSTGSDGAITQRRAYFKQPAGSYLVPDGTTTEYVEWALADTSMDFDILGETDKALIITVQWLNVSNAVLYDKTNPVAGFTSFNEDFDYQLTELMTANPLLINDNNFYYNKSKLRTEIDSGNQAIERAADQYGAQKCYDRATELRIYSQYNFNGNS